MQPLYQLFIEALQSTPFIFTKYPSSVKTSIRRGFHRKLHRPALAIGWNRAQPRHEHVCRRRYSHRDSPSPHGSLHEPPVGAKPHHGRSGRSAGAAANSTTQLHSEQPTPQDEALATATIHLQGCRSAGHGAPVTAAQYRGATLVAAPGLPYVAPNLALPRAPPTMCID